jgi:hypothetical protein
VVAEEVAGGTPAGDHIPTDGVELGRGHAGLHRSADPFMHLRNDTTGRSHLSQFIVRATSHGLQISSSDSPKCGIRI